MKFVKLNVSQLDEVGDIIGFPIKEYEAQLFTAAKKPDGTIAWTPGKTVWGTEQTFNTYKGKYRTAHTVTYGNISTISTCPTNYQAAKGTTKQSNCQTGAGRGSF